MELFASENPLAKRRPHLTAERKAGQHTDLVLRRLWLKTTEEGRW
jgi:hypothetical protein